MKYWYKEHEVCLAPYCFALAGNVCRSGEIYYLHCIIISLYVFFALRFLRSSFAFAASPLVGMHSMSTMFFLREILLLFSSSSICFLVCYFVQEFLSEERFCHKDTSPSNKNPLIYVFRFIIIIFTYNIIIIILHNHKYWLLMLHAHIIICFRYHMYFSTCAVWPVVSKIFWIVKKSIG